MKRFRYIILGISSIIGVIGLLVRIFWWPECDCSGAKSAFIPRFLPDYPGTPVEPSFLLQNGSWIKLPQDSVRLDSIIATIPKEDLKAYSIDKGVMIIIPPLMRYKVRLPDGTDVLLAGGTGIEVPVDFDTLRALKLRGSAFFTIPKVNRPPLRVVTSVASFLASPGQFEIFTHSDDEYILTALSSSVTAIEPTGGKNLAKPYTRTSKRNSGAWNTKQIPPYYVPRWTQNSIDFYDERFMEAVVFIVQHYGKDVIIEPAAALSLPVSIHAEYNAPLPIFLDVVRQSTGIDYKIEGDTILFSASDKFL